MIKRIYPAYQPSMPPEHDVLQLGENLHISPDVLFSSGGSVFGTGTQGSGKTSIMVRILEQAARFQIPMCVWDLEGDVLSSVSQFPRGVIGTQTDCPSARDIVKLGLQCVFDLSSWGLSMDAKGDFVSRMVHSLYTVVDALPPSQRTPIILGLDECALWLPQKRAQVFSVETYKALAEAWHLVATTGRKRGLVPLLFTQKISEVNKMVLSPGTYILGRQTVHVDQKRYLDYIERRDGEAFRYMSDRQLCQYFSSLQPGTAIVKLSTGEQRIVTFYERTSQHISHTPKVSSAMSRYSALSFNPNMRFGADMEESAPPAKRAPVSITQASAGKAQCKKCGAPATHAVNYSSGRRGYFCSEHASKSCKPL